MDKITLGTRKVSIEFPGVKALSDVDKKLVEVNRDNSAKKQKLNAEQFIESNSSCRF